MVVSWVLIGAAAMAAQGASDGFPNIPAGHWAAPSVQALRLLGVLTGYPADGARKSKAVPSGALEGRTVTITSPNGKLKASIYMPRPRESRSPEWILSFGKEVLLQGCRLSLTAAEKGDLLANASVVSAKTQKHRSVVPVLFGKAAKAHDDYQLARFELRTQEGGRLLVEFRCYDDALAYRYEVLSLPGVSRLVVASEESSFRPVGNPKAFAQYLPNFTTSHEVPHTVLPLHKLQGGQLLDTPLTLQRKDGICLSITEAALTRYAGMSLMRPIGDVDGDLVCRLSPRTDGNKVVSDLPMKTPWRVVLVGKNPGALLESNTLYCLNPPNVIGDTSWIKPGKMTWTWWNNYLFDHERGEPIFTTEVQKKHIDWCAKNGIAFHDVVADERDHPWYFNGQDGLFPAPNADVTRVRPELDLAAVSAYAKAKGVRLWTWVHQGALRGKDLDAVFARFAQLGWSGMMVDFFDHDDQETVEFAERILQAAAKHHILIHFHGMYKPTGWQRTYPNLMNHEGSRNLEYLKWGDTCTPEHSLTVAFTRLVAGPMDYHLGGFRSSTRARFRAQNVAPVVLGTRGFNLALYVCFDNANPMAADYPMAYEGQKGFDFIKEVPTWWDETRVLKAEIGKLLVVARRKGPDWWIGGASAGKPRVVDVPLTFLTQRFYGITTWSDGPDAERNPNDLAASTVIVAGQKSLRIRCATDGGFVCRLRQH